jgi:hypothetical protein
VLNAPGGVNGKACDELQTIAGVTGAGAIRSRPDPIALAQLPGTPVPAFDVTPSFAAQLALEKTGPTGVLLPTSLAETLGLTTGEAVHYIDGTAPLAGMYAFPEDGRDATLAYAALGLVPSEGNFDSCWVTTQPYQPEIRTLLRTTLTAELPETNTVEITQLNPRLGQTFDGNQEYLNRSTKYLPAVAAIAALLVGIVATRRRKLELASSQHVGVPRTALVTQLLIEGTLLATALICLTTAWGLIAAQFGTGYGAEYVRLGVLSALSATIGSALALATVRPTQLLQYGKDA